MNGVVEREPIDLGIRLRQVKDNSSNMSIGGRIVHLKLTNYVHGDWSIEVRRRMVLNCLHGNPLILKQMNWPRQIWLQSSVGLQVKVHRKE